MSLVNVYFHAKQALVCVDTECGYKDPQGKEHRGEASKMAVLPHLNIVLAVRGVNYTLSIVYATAAHIWPSSFEGIASNIPPMILNAVEHTRKNVPNLEIGKQEIMMVGHCSKADRMRAIHFWLEPGGEVEQYEMQEEDSMVSPWMPEWGEPFEARTPDIMRITALEQIRRCREQLPDAPLGGRLLLAEVTKDAVNMRQLAVVPAREPASQSGGAVSRVGGLLRAFANR